MPNFAPSLTIQNRSVGIDLAIGQIDLIGESGEVAKSWRIRKPRCTIGSSPDCTIQLTTTEIAPLHATLVFGKKHTLLRSVGPTLISKRHVREWLIDESIEIVIGQSRLIVHPSNCISASVVQSSNLIDQASRLCKEPTPISVAAPQTVDQALKEQSLRPEVTKNEPFDAIAGARLDTIEKLLESLKASLEKMQASIGLEAKSSSESIVQSVTLEIDEFGKRLFTDLNKQISNQTGVQESLITGMADQFSGRFGAIDEQLNRFNESSNFQTTTLNELLAQAASDQQKIETRFQEVVAHRNELMDAVQILRTEILLASGPDSNTEPHSQQTEAAQVADSSFTQTHFVDAPTNTVYTDYAESSLSNTDNEYIQTNAMYSAHVQDPVLSVTDEQLAHSLGLAQIQIQELNSQLRNLEIERDAAEQRVASLSESWQIDQEQLSQPLEPSAYSENASATELEPQEQSEVSYENPSYLAIEEINVVDVPLPTNHEEAPYVATSQEQESEYYEEPSFKSRELPAWFKQDEPEQTYTQVDSSYETENTHSSSPESSYSFATPNLSSYSDLEYPSESFGHASLADQDSTSQEPIPSSNDDQVDSELGDYNPNLENLNSISDRLQRMLADADQRRTPSNPSSTPRTSQSWSQKFASPSGNAEPADLEYQRSEPSQEAVASTYKEFAEPPARDYPERRSESFSESHDSNREHYEEPSHDSVPDEPLDEYVPSDKSFALSSSLAASAASENNEQQFDSQPNRATEEEESIETYMQRLLHRVRGEAEKSPEVGQTETPVVETPAQSIQSTPTKPRSRVAASMGLEMEDSLPPVSERLSEELFVPRQQAPEQRNDLAALRELANTNARRAINRSDIRRTNSAFFLKLGVTALAVFSAVALFLFNGLTLNAPFAGMIAAIVVALLWGFDCVNHFKLLKNVGSNQATPAETAAGQSIRVGNSDESGWRPTPV